MTSVLYSAEEIHSVGTINNVETSYFTQLKICHLLPNDNVSMSVGHLDHILIVYSSMEHVTWTTTYFSFRGIIYQQMFGAAMGSPVSPLLANLFMEWLEKQAVATAPVECKPKFWNQYVDDVLELIKKGQVRNLTDHINTIDPTGNIKFTYKEEEDKQITFLDTLLVRREDGSVKLLVYRKKSHTDQYLNFGSHHPLNHKLAVIRTLLEKYYSIVMEEDDRKKEEIHIAEALSKCGYPPWTTDRVKQDIVEKSLKDEGMV